MSEDEFDRTLSEWEAELEKYLQYMLKHAQDEAELKSLEAQTRKAFMNQGDSAAKAEIHTRADDNWVERYLTVQKGHAYVEHAKRRLALLQAKFEAERTRQANARQVH